MMMSIRPRCRLGISSSMAELIAAYSPPMPKPVRKRNRKNHHGANENAVSAVAARYTPSVIMKSFLRPNRSVSQPKNRAPTQAPATYGRTEPGDLALGDVDAAIRHGDLAGDVADDRDFQAVEDPDRAQADDDHPVPPGPGQPVQPRRHLGLDVPVCTSLTGLSPPARGGHPCGPRARCPATRAPAVTRPLVRPSRSAATPASRPIWDRMPSSRKPSRGPTRLRTTVIAPQATSPAMIGPTATERAPMTLATGRPSGSPPSIHSSSMEARTSGVHRLTAELITGQDRAVTSPSAAIRPGSGSRAATARRGGLDRKSTKTQSANLPLSASAMVERVASPRRR